MKGPDILFERGRIKRIHINKHIHLRNLKGGKYENGTYKPIITAKISGKTYYADHVDIRGKSELKFDPVNRMPGCEAVVWIETDSEVVLFGVVTPDRPGTS